MKNYKQLYCNKTNTLSFPQAKTLQITNLSLLGFGDAVNKKLSSSYGPQSPYTELWVSLAQLYKRPELNKRWERQISKTKRPAVLKTIGRMRQR